MFDIGGSELLLLAILALVIFGPRRLPELGRQFGGFVAHLRHAMRDAQTTLEREVNLDEFKQAAREVQELRRDAASVTRELTSLGGEAPRPAAGRTPPRRDPMPEIQPPAEESAATGSLPLAATSAIVPDGDRAADTTAAVAGPAPLVDPAGR